MNLLPYVILWSLLAIVVLALAIKRRQVAANEDDSLHLSSVEAAMVQEQVQMATRLERIEKWGKGLTVVLAITGAVLAGLYGWQMWEATATAGLR